MKKHYNSEVNRHRSVFDRRNWMHSIAATSLFVSLFTVLSTTYAREYTVADIPNPKKDYGGFVSDPDGLLNLDDKQKLNSLLQSIEDMSTNQVAVVIVQSIGSAVPKDFAVELFNTWEIGQKGKDNGVLILTVLDQHAWEIEIGYGLEGILNDARVGRIGRATIVPNFREGNYGMGLISAVYSLQKIMEVPENQVEGVVNEIDPQHRTGVFSQMTRDQWTVFWMYLIIGLIISLMLYIRMFKLVKLEESAPIVYKKMGLPLPIIMAILFPLPGIALPFVNAILRNRVRYRPKVGSKGQPMRLLNEDDDDKFLKAGELCEEMNRSVDYDVWISENDDETMILRYNNPFSSLKVCTGCTYKTMKHIETVILEYATEYSSGRGMRISRCLNCGKEISETYTIPRKSSSSSSSSSFGGGSSSHSSSFGGGHSGGGGAGGKW